MKRIKLIKALRSAGCHAVREGGRHTVWTNPRTGATDVVPRHKEISTRLARSICRTLDAEPPDEN